MAAQGHYIEVKTIRGLHMERKTLRREVLQVLVLPMILAAILFKVVFNIIVVPTSSMEPTLKINHFYLSYRLPFLVSAVLKSEQPAIRTGDIVVFWSDELDVLLVKRVIGVEGDHIEFNEGAVIINGQQMKYDYSNTINGSFCNKDFDVPKGCVFVMGDNRQHSTDSREFENPYISIDSIMSQVLFIG